MIEPSGQGVPEWFSLDFKNMERSLNGGSSNPFHALRKKAFSRFQQLGFPSPKLEAWKSTNVAPIARTAFSLAYPVGDRSIQEKQAVSVIPPALGPRMVFIDGAFSKTLSSEAIRSNSLRYLPLGEVLSSHGAAQTDSEFVEQHLARHAPYEDEAFVAFNTAFTTDGALIVIGKGQVIDEPLELVFYSSGEKENVVSHPRVLVVAEENSQVTLLERYIGISGENTYFTSAVSEIILKENSLVDHYRLQQEGRSAYHVSTLHASQARGSRFSTHSFSFGGCLVRNNVQPGLYGEGAEVVLNGLSVLRGKQHVDNHTVIEHAEPHCESHEWYKGIYDDDSKGVFCGTIIVKPDAQKTNAIQSNQSLLLSDKSSVDTKPQLKIWANDVKCTHGATVGQLDEGAMYYLRSRGIDKESALKIMIRAFAGDIIEQVKIDALREELYRNLEERLV